MVDRLWDAFRSLISRRDDAADESETESDEGQFIPSPLDWSVRFGHGGSSSERVRELTRLRETADELDEAQRRK